MLAATPAPKKILGQILFVILFNTVAFPTYIIHTVRTICFITMALMSAIFTSWH